MQRLLSNMPAVAIACGGLLILVGLIGYGIGFLGDYASWTALIPAFAGVPILLAGLVATRGGKVQMHAMHVAVIFGLLGTIAPLGRLPKTLSADPINPVAAGSMVAMMLISAAFTALCVMSFIAARKARKNEAVAT